MAQALPFISLYDGIPLPQGRYGFNLFFEHGIGAHPLNPSSAPRSTPALLESCLSRANAVVCEGELPPLALPFLKHVCFLRIKDGIKEGGQLCLGDLVSACPKLFALHVQVQALPSSVLDFSPLANLHFLDVDVDTPRLRVPFSLWESCPLRSVSFIMFSECAPLEFYDDEGREPGQIPPHPTLVAFSYDIFAGSHEMLKGLSRAEMVKKMKTGPDYPVTVPPWLWTSPRMKVVRISGETLSPPPSDELPMMKHRRFKDGASFFWTDDVNDDWPVNPFHLGHKYAEESCGEEFKDVPLPDVDAAFTALVSLLPSRK